MTYGIAALSARVYLLSGPLHYLADPVSKPHEFSACDPISASVVNENFDTLYDSTAAGIDSTNLASDNEHHWRNAYYIWVKEE